MTGGEASYVSPYVLLPWLIVAASSALLLCVLAAALWYTVHGLPRVPRVRELRRFGVVALVGGLWAAGLAITTYLIMQGFAADFPSPQSPAHVEQVDSALNIIQAVTTATGIVTGLLVLAALLMLAWRLPPPAEPM